MSYVFTIGLICLLPNKMTIASQSSLLGVSPQVVSPPRIPRFPVVQATLVDIQCLISVQSKRFFSHGMPCK